MGVLGAFAILFDNQDRVLLSHRRDYDLWNLPGGRIERGELPTEAVIREVKEETGYDVTIERLVGVYSKDKKADLIFSFQCKLKGGKLRTTDEADKHAYYQIENLPVNTIPKHVERILDAVKAKPYPIFKRQRLPSTDDFLDMLEGTDSETPGDFLSACLTWNEVSLSLKHIKLKKPTWDDMRYIRQLWGDPETMKAVGGPIHLDDKQATSWFRKMIDPGGNTDYYRLILNKENDPVGEISFHRLAMKTMTAEFNIKIAHSHRGKGYAKEAMVIFLDHYFNELDGRVLVDKLAMENVHGQRVLLNFGFEHEPDGEEV